MNLAPQFSIVTLGVGDLDRSTAFYASLGWEQKGRLSDGIVWFRTTGTWIGLYPTADLAADAGLELPPSLPAYRGITLALNYGSRDEVDAAFNLIAEAGGTIVKPSERTDWGGYSGYIADPDGVLWEIAHAPGFSIDEQGRLRMP